MSAPAIAVCCIDETQQDYPNTRGEAGVRSAVISSYDIPKLFYAQGMGMSRKKRSAVCCVSNLGALLNYAHRVGYTVRPRKRRKDMDVEALVEKWKTVIVGLAIAHDKDEADRYEAAIDECLNPLLTAPINQVRQFASRFLEELKKDKRVPFLVWRSYEIWVEMVISKADDEGVKQLKTELAKEIVDMVEGDVREQLPEAMVRALQWRSAEKLEEVKKVVQEEKEKGNKARLRGRESCLFLEVGGTEEAPAVCVQV